VYGRVINGEEFTFGVSGKLIKNALVMYDHQTRTLWSQFLRKGVQGELAGTELEVVPVTQTTWEAWRELHPHTLVLDKRGRYRSDQYSGYYLGNRAGVLGESSSDARLRPKELVVGVDIAGSSKAYPFSVLRRQPVVNDVVSGQSALVYFDASNGTALVYDRTVDGSTLTFRLDGEPQGVLTKLVDDETNSRWMAFTGLAVSGELKGKRLGRALSHLSFWFAWKDWNPQTELYQG
jgi:hypothetical protein